uniref:Uncharacterized protein n=1 Tax=Knipowitschia caucasica TaxID=637954 RepID=A0AAV2K7D4_KNICA
MKKLAYSTSILPATSLFFSSASSPSLSYAQSSMPSSRSAELNVGGVKRLTPPTLSSAPICGLQSGATRHTHTEFYLTRLDVEPLLCACAGVAVQQPSALIQTAPFLRVYPEISRFITSLYDPANITATREAVTLHSR